MSNKIVAKLVSKEMIKPSSPTPPHLRDYKISLIEQFGPSHYLSFVIFYLNPPNNTNLAASEFRTLLKESLSETLTRFYPLAGRFIKEENIVRCNDGGIEYSEARIEGVTVSEFINNPDIDVVTILFARRSEMIVSPSDVLIAIRANYVDCGGVAIAVSFSHKIADGATIGMFLECWASIARRRQHHTNEKIIYPSFDGIYNILPPISPLVDEPTAGISYHAKRLETSTRRFVFDESTIAALKVRGTNEDDKLVPTRTQVVVALLWKCIISEIASEYKSYKKKLSILGQMVNLRGRMDPPLPDVSFGNIVKVALAAWPIDENYKNDDDDKMYRMLVKELRDCVAKIDDAYAKNRDLDPKVLRIPLHAPFMKILSDPAAKRMCSVTSCLTFPFYEIDFGWGVPARLATCDLRGEFIVLFRSRDGVEALVCLEKTTMSRFEKNPELLAFCFGSRKNQVSSGVTVSRL